MARNNMTIDWI